MNLDDQQKQKVMAWIQEGQTLSEIQNRLASELGLRLTYMEVRFLLDDLKLKPVDKEPPSTTAPSVPEAKDRKRPGGVGAKAETHPKESFPSAEPPKSAAPGRVAVAVDQLTRPGALVSGKVTFADGNSAEWHLDQFGRLGVVPKQPGYKPSQSDLTAFQTELQNELAKLGF